MATPRMLKPFVHKLLAIVSTSLVATTPAHAYSGCPSSLEQSYRCEQYKETELLRKNPSLAVRAGGNLGIYIARGGLVWFIDHVPKDVDEGTGVLYMLSALHPGTPYVEVYASLYEGHDRYLVNRLTGVKTLVTGAVLMSPDSKRFVVWSDDEAHTRPFLRIYRIDRQALKMEFDSDELPQGWPQKMRWASSTEVRFRGVMSGEFRLAAHRNQGHPGTEWKLTELPSSW